VLLRLAVALAVLGVVAALTVVYRRRRGSATPAAGDLPALPAGLRSGGSRTWVVFTTPYCASCGPLAERLRAADPDAGVVTVDATRRPDLAGAYRVRSAPTTVLAGPSGDVLAHLVGAEAVSRYLAS